MWGCSSNSRSSCCWSRCSSPPRIATTRLHFSNEGVTFSTDGHSRTSALREARRSATRCHIEGGTSGPSSVETCTARSFDDGWPVTEVLSHGVARKYDFACHWRLTRPNYSGIDLLHVLLISLSAKFKFISSISASTNSSALALKA